jgi:hypothetical protein
MRLSVMELGRFKTRPFEMRRVRGESSQRQIRVGLPELYALAGFRAGGRVARYGKAAGADDGHGGGNSQNGLPEACSVPGERAVDFA